MSLNFNFSAVLTRIWADQIYFSRGGALPSILAFAMIASSGCEILRHHALQKNHVFLEGQETPSEAAFFDSSIDHEGSSFVPDPLPPVLRLEYTGALSRVLNLMAVGLDFDGMPPSLFQPLGAAAISTQRQMISDFCLKVDQSYRKIGWQKSPCSELKWAFSFRSEKGNPLIYWEFVDEEARNQSRLPLQTTLILGGVHPDELTPIHLAFEFARSLADNPGIYKNSRVIIAPVVNPDGFLRHPQSRTNSNGVDLNRNFATADWWQRAGKNWAELRKRDPRHFPGLAPNTEQGTRFQVYLMQRYEPDKILTIHAPLGFLDYDGPGERTSSTGDSKLSSNDERAFELASLISKRSNNYRIMNYAIFPGSLGNFAGNDRRIPTITVELDSTNARKVNEYRRSFFPGLHAAVRYQFQRDLILVSQGDPDTTLPDSAKSSSESGNF